MAACPASTSNGEDTRYDFICTNGTPADGFSSVEDTTKCKSCNDGFKFTQAQTCVAHAYVCTHGTPSGEDATADNITRCTECASGFKLSGVTCVPTVYTCQHGTPRTGSTTSNADEIECASCNSGFIITADKRCNHRYICNNGTPVDDTDATGDNVTQCASCTSGYLLTTTNSCANDIDGDGVLNVADVDDDNDGLIEVGDLTALHNMRYNLAGTSYKTSSAGTGSTAGAPTAGNKAADYACSGTGLCGYELTQRLTFDKDGDGKTFEADGSGGFTLDSGDNANPYFVVADGGWLPIGDRTNAFTAIFEGNGYTISHMAISRDQKFIAMFGVIDTGAHIRNVGLVNSLSDLIGNTDRGSDNGIAGLVGQQNNGIISASYADVTVGGYTDNGNRLGGLVGYTQNGTIIASYATGTVDGRGGNSNAAGGLVGRVHGGDIIASYATTSVNGGTGSGDQVGGLVGNHSTGVIIASYATGSVDGGTGSADGVGKLIGRRGTNRGFYIASYGFGTTSNVDTIGIDGSTLPDGVSAATGLTISNTVTSGTCVGIADPNAYTTSSTCTSTAKTQCSWSFGECSGTVNGINCAAFGSQSTCEATTKTAGTWTTNVWNNAAANTAGAWDFGTSSQAPALRYADYDGSGNTYNCNQFPSSVTCGTTLLPGQR